MTATPVVSSVGSAAILAPEHDRIRILAACRVTKAAEIAT